MDELKENGDNPDGLSALIQRRASYRPSTALQEVQTRFADNFLGDNVGGLVNSLKQGIWMIPPLFAGYAAIEYLIAKHVTPLIGGKKAQPNADSGAKLVTTFPISLNSAVKNLVWLGAFYLSAGIGRTLFTHEDEVVRPKAELFLNNLIVQAGSAAENPLIVRPEEVAGLLGELRKLPEAIKSLENRLDNSENFQEAIKPLRTKLDQMGQGGDYHPPTEQEIEAGKRAINVLERDQQEIIGDSLMVAKSLRASLALHDDISRGLIAITSAGFAPGYLHRVLLSPGQATNDDLHSALSLSYYLIFEDAGKQYLSPAARSNMANEVYALSKKVGSGIASNNADIKGVTTHIWAHLLAELSHDKSRPVDKELFESGALGELFEDLERIKVAPEPRKRQASKSFIAQSLA